MLTYICLLGLFSLSACVIPDTFDYSDNNQMDDSFYDIVYDSQINCPSYIEGVAVSDHVFVGASISTKFVATTADCLIECYKDSACKSINVIPNRRRHAAAISSTSTTDKNENTTRKLVDNAYICELNDFQQSDSPFLMISMDGATYFENIKCVSEPNHVTEKTVPTIKETPAPSDKEIKRKRLLQLGNLFKNLLKEPNID